MDDSLVLSLLKKYLDLKDAKIKLYDPPVLKINFNNI
jgi:hypothetical protein